VEGWSMVIPWIGYSFSEIIKKVEPTGNAKYVEFVTWPTRSRCRACSRVLHWPYTEGLRIDEANTRWRC
jgi:sulfoxide reductase catalytic subunit YedY